METNKEITSGKAITVRLKKDELEKLNKIKDARGLDQSAAIRFAIMNIPILAIGNVGNLADEFCRLRMLIEKDEYEKVRMEVDKLCRCIFDLLVEVENLKRSELF